MTFVLADRVKDTTITAGLGTVTLSGTAPTGYQTFGTGIGNANTTYYTIAGGAEWEVGIGTYTAAGTTLSRDTVLASSAGGTTKVTFSSGTKDVFVTYPAEDAVYTDGPASFTSLAYNTTLTGGTGIVALGTSQFYKDASGNVGIGTASPLAKIHIQDEASSGFYMDGYANSSGPIIRTRAARGTFAAPTAAIANTLIGGMRGFGYNGTAFGTAYAGGVNIFAAETFTTIAQGTYVTVNTTALGAVATTERMRIDAAGNVGIGNTPSGTYKLEVTGAISATGAITSSVATGTAPLVVASTTNVANLNASSLDGATFAAPGAIGGTTRSTGAFTTLNVTGAITSTLAIGTAPFVVTSTTNVANLNASSLNGATFAAPGAIGGGTAAAGTFTALSYSTTLTGGTGIVNLGSGQFYKDASGNVGIGTASPVASTTSRLFLNGDLTLISGGANILGSNIYYHTVNGWTTAAAGYGSAVRGDNTAGGLGFWTSSASTGANTVSPTFAQRMLLDANGNLGIGNTPSGTYKLEVTGTVNATLIAATRINPRIGTVASAATITPTGDASDQYNVTALAVAATIAIPSGTPVNGQRLTLRIKDNGTARALTWTTSAGGYRIVGTTLPTTTVISKTVYVGCVYNAADSFWDVIAVAQQV